MEKKKIVRKKKTSKKYIVVFQDAEEKVLKTVFVEDGDSVEGPVMAEVLEEKEHHRILFAGWNQDLTSVHSNLVVCPIYKEVPKEYLVMYFHENGKILGTETVPYGADARGEFHPVKAETPEYRYYFDGWNCDLTHISRDTMAKAVFRKERKQFLVRFLNEEDVLLKESAVYYGEKAVPPENVTKAEDKTYRYHFTGWDQEYSTITGDLDVHAVFRPEYIEYTVRFFEEGKWIEENRYHYQDSITYPSMWKKGYDYFWDQEIEFVTESIDLDGSWHFSNPKGMKAFFEDGLYEITNPSIHHGSVSCVMIENDREIIEIPSRVKLGDYFYEVESVGGNAFRKCRNLRKLICPDTVKTLEKDCLKGCTKVESITLGKNLIKLDAFVFAGCTHLKQVIICGKKIRKVHRDTFEKMPPRVEILVPKDMVKTLYNLFERGIRQKGLILRE